VVSVNYRLLPAANPLQQAQDVAKALALVQQKAASWGADGQRVALMGHSSGGHLVSLLNAAPQLAYAQGAQPWRGTVNLDGAALDVPALMRARHAPLYDRAFGRDPAFWESVSPLHVLERKPPPPLLVICSSLRSDSCPQADAFERKASPLQHRMTIWTQPMGHSDIDRQLGLPGPYTDSVARWISSIL
jgi:acetyl esterase/lipase